MLAVQVLTNARPGAPRTDGESGEGLFEIIARLGPVTGFELAREALVPRFFVQVWLAGQEEAGYLHRDPVTGRYAPWCPWPRQIEDANGGTRQ
jgi:hypothetical protein